MRKKILFVIYSIYGGGAEKQMQYILKYIDRNKFEPHLAVFRLKGKEKDFLPKDVPLYNLSTKLRPASYFLRRKLTRLIKSINPDKVLSFMWGGNLISISAAKRRGVSIIVSERTVPSVDIPKYSFSSLRKKSISKNYLYADRIIANAMMTKEDLASNFDIPYEMIRVIYNMIDIPALELAGDAFKPSEESYILGVGRLDEEKNFKFLLDAVSKIDSKDKIKVVLLGEGDERENLKKHAKDLGVDLKMPGYIDNPYPWMKNAQVFVLSSTYEGMPNVVLEAMCLNTPVIATDCPGAIREMIESEVNGLLVPLDDSKHLAESIQRVLSSKDLSKKFIKNSKKKIKDYDIKNIIPEWEETLGELEIV